LLIHPSRGKSLKLNQRSKEIPIRGDIQSHDENDLRRNRDGSRPGAKMEAPIESHVVIGAIHANDHRGIITTMNFLPTMAITLGKITVIVFRLERNRGLDIHHSSGAMIMATTITATMIFEIPTVVVVFLIARVMGPRLILDHIPEMEDHLATFEGDPGHIQATEVVLRGIISMGINMVHRDEAHRSHHMMIVATTMKLIVRGGHHIQNQQEMVGGTWDENFSATQIEKYRSFSFKNKGLVERIQCKSKQHTFVLFFRSVWILIIEHYQLFLSVDQ